MLHRRRVARKQSEQRQSKAEKDLPGLPDTREIRQEPSASRLWQLINQPFALFLFGSVAAGAIVSLRDVSIACRQEFSRAQEVLPAAIAELADRRVRWMEEIVAANGDLAVLMAPSARSTRTTLHIRPAFKDLSTEELEARVRALAGRFRYKDGEPWLPWPLRLRSIAYATNPLAEGQEVLEEDGEILDPGPGERTWTDWLFGRHRSPVVRTTRPNPVFRSRSSEQTVLFLRLTEHWDLDVRDYSTEDATRYAAALIHVIRAQRSYQGFNRLELSPTCGIVDAAGGLLTGQTATVGTVRDFR